MATEDERDDVGRDEADDEAPGERPVDGDGGLQAHDADASPREDADPLAGFDLGPLRAATASSPSAAAPVATAVTEPDGHRRRRARHTWPQRALLALNVLVILACFAGAAGLLIGRELRNDLQTVALPTDALPPTTAMGVGTPEDDTPPATLAPGETIAPGQTSPAATAPEETFPPADPEAKNFLVTGADNNACIDADSPYAPAFGDRSTMGERSDTVMIMRVDPSTNRAAVLSFPRDLWVEIAGRGGAKQRINTAYVRDDPTRLIYTIGLNFEIPVDHFIQIDFCAFKTIVDSVGGVSVPFLFPARDTHTGLYVPTPGCFNFDGDHALAYVRSRYYQYFVDDKWKSDPRSDLSRISRQQDFIRRMLSAALGRGLVRPSVASGLIDAATENLVVDDRLTLSTMLEFVGVLRNVEPGSIATYQIESASRRIAGNAVLEPRLTSENMQAILRIFRGEAPLAAAPEQVFESTTTVDPAAPGETGDAGDPGAGPASSPDAPTAVTTTSTATTASTTTTTGATDAAETTVEPATTVPAPAEIIEGIVPPRNVTCD